MVVGDVLPLTTSAGTEVPARRLNAMGRWLEDFAYRIEISWPIFLMAGLAAFVVALLTVSYQSIRAAMTDPVEALRYE